jgi:hypothetical protein
MLADPHLVVLHRVVRSHERQRCFVVNVLPLAARPLMRLGQQHNSFAPAATALLPP